MAYKANIDALPGDLTDLVLELRDTAKEYASDPHIGLVCKNAADRIRELERARRLVYEEGKADGAKEAREETIAQAARIINGGPRCSKTFCGRNELVDHMFEMFKVIEEEEDDEFLDQLDDYWDPVWDDLEEEWRNKSE